MTQKSNKGNEYSAFTARENSRSTFRPKAQPKVVKDLLRSTLSRFGIDEQVSKYQFVLDWDKIVGPEIASRSKPHSLERGVLVVRVVNSEWAQELVFQKDVILSRLAKYSLVAGDTETARVTDIRFVVGAR